MKEFFESNIRIWWSSRKLLRMKWTLEVGCIILLLIFTLGLTSDLVDLKYVFQFLAFFHGCLVANLYYTLFSNISYPMFPGGSKKGLLFSFIELIVGWVQVTTAYSFLQYYLKVPVDVSIQNMLGFALLWIAGWIVVRIAQKLYLLSVLTFPLYVLFVHLRNHEMNYHIYLVLMGMTLASSYAQVFQKKLTGRDAWRPFSKQYAVEKKQESWIRELMSLGPKIHNITAFPSIPKLAYFFQALLSSGAVLFLMIVASLSMFVLVTLVLADARSAFGGDIRSFVYVFSSLFCALMGAFNSDMLENGVPGFMSLSRNSWLKLRTSAQILNQLAALVAIVLTPLIVEVAVNLILKQQFLISNHYWFSMLIVAGGYPLIVLASLLFKLGHDRKLFSQNRSLNWTEYGTTPVKTSQVLVLVGGIFASVGCLIGIMYLFATNVLTIELLKSVQFLVPALTIYLIAIVVMQFVQNKLEARLILKGDLV